MSLTGTNDTQYFSTDWIYVIKRMQWNISPCINISAENNYWKMYHHMQWTQSKWNPRKVIPQLMILFYPKAVNVTRGKEIPAHNHPSDRFPKVKRVANWQLSLLGMHNCLQSIVMSSCIVIWCSPPQISGCILKNWRHQWFMILEWQI